jgi:hypothetical protein
VEDVHGPCLGIFIDGVCADSRNWAYPKPESAATTVVYSIGKAGSENLLWCVASTYLLCVPICKSLSRKHRGCPFLTTLSSRRPSSLHSPSISALHWHIPSARPRTDAHIRIRHCSQHFPVRKHLQEDCLFATSVPRFASRPPATE